MHAIYSDTHNTYACNNHKQKTRREDQVTTVHQPTQYHHLHFLGSFPGEPELAHTSVLPTLGLEENS